MHCQSQISIIWNNGVERAHKSKNADKTHPDKLYKQGRHKRKKKERSACWCQKRHRCKQVGPGHLTLVLQVLKQALGAGHRPAATALPTLAGSALQSACSGPFGSLPNTVCSPHILISMYQAPSAHQTILGLVVSSPHFWTMPNSYKSKSEVADGIQ